MMDKHFYFDKKPVKDVLRQTVKDFLEFAVNHDEPDVIYSSVTEWLEDHAHLLYRWADEFFEGNTDE